MSWGLASASNVATTSLLAKQKQMSVISTNVANADNPYYHRRSASMESLDLAGSNTYGGTGVFIASVSRAYDQALESSLQNAIGNNSYMHAFRDRVMEMERVLGPNGENFLAGALSDFAASLQQLASDPESISARSALLANGNAIASEFNTEYNNLAALRDSIASNNASGNGFISTQLGEVNGLLKQIAEVNDNIRRVEDNSFRSQQALELRDERDRLVKELSNYIDFSIQEEDNMQYTLEMNLAGGGKVTLIDGTTEPQDPPDTLQMTMVEAPAGFFSPQIVVASDPATALTLNTETGSIRALLDSREYINSRMDELYQFANIIATEINALQNNASAYDLDGNNNAGNLFSSPASRPASGTIFTLDPGIAGNPRKIAVSTALNQSGNGDNAMLMWDKLNEPALFNNESLMQYSDRILSNVALKVSELENLSRTTDNVREMFQSAVAERSSVSMDEEMVNMLELQRSYQAVAKMVSVIDRMVENVINLV